MLECTLIEKNWRFALFKSTGFSQDEHRVFQVFSISHRVERDKPLAQTVPSIGSVSLVPNAFIEDRQDYREIG